MAMLPESEPFLTKSDVPAEQIKPNAYHDDLYEPAKKTPGKLYTSWLLPILSHFTVFVLTSILWGTAFIILFPPSSSKHSQGSTRHVGTLESYDYRENNVTSDSKLLICGRSTPEAKELGCKYDILSNHWVPEPCMDQEAVEAYQADGSWFGYGDEGRTELLSIDAMSEMEFYYTSERDRIVHCAMLWRKQFIAFYEKRPMLDTLIASWKHTMHCANFLIDMSDRGPDYRNIPIKTWVGYAGCWVREDDSV